MRRFLGPRGRRHLHALLGQLTRHFQVGLAGTQKPADGTGSSGRRRRHPELQAGHHGRNTAPDTRAHHPARAGKTHLGRFLGARAVIGSRQTHDDVVERLAEHGAARAAERCAGNRAGAGLDRANRAATKRAQDGQNRRSCRR